MNTRCRKDLSSKTDLIMAVFRRVYGNKGFVLWTDPAITAEEIKALVRMFALSRRDLCPDRFAGIQQIRFRQGMEYLSLLHTDRSIIDLAHSLLAHPLLTTGFVIPHELRRYLLDFPSDPLSEFMMVCYDCLQFDLVAGRQASQIPNPNARIIIRLLGALEEAGDNGPWMQRMLQRIDEKVRRQKRMISPAEFMPDAMEYARNEPCLKAMTRDLFARDDDPDTYVNKFTATMKNVRWDALPESSTRDALIVYDDHTLGQFGSGLAAELTSQNIRIQGRQGLPGSGDLLGSCDPSSKTLTIPIPSPDGPGPRDPDWYFAAVVVQRTRYLLQEEPELLGRMVTRMRKDASFRSNVQNLMRRLLQAPMPASSTERSVPAFRPDLPLDRDFEVLAGDLLCRINHAQCLAGALVGYEQMKFLLSQVTSGAMPREITARISRLHRVLRQSPAAEALKGARAAEAFLVKMEPELKAVFQHPFFSTLRMMSPMDGLRLGPVPAARPSASSTAVKDRERRPLATVEDETLDAEEIADKLATFSYATVLEIARTARNPICLDAVAELALAGLASGDGQKGRELEAALVDNPRTSLKTLKAFAQNPATPADKLRIAVASNPNMSPAILEKLLAADDDRVKIKLVCTLTAADPPVLPGGPERTIDFLLEMLDNASQSVASGVASCKCLPQRLIRALAVRQGARQALAYRRDLPPDVIEALYRTGSPKVRKALVMNWAVSLPASEYATILDTGFSDDGTADWHVRCAIAKKPNLDVRTMRALAADDVIRVRAFLAGHPHLPEDVAETLATDPIPYVRAHVAGNPHAPLRILRRLCHDTAELTHGLQDANGTRVEGFLYVEFRKLERKKETVRDRLASNPALLNVPAQADEPMPDVRCREAQTRARGRGRQGAVKPRRGRVPASPFYERLLKPFLAVNADPAPLLRQGTGTVRIRMLDSGPFTAHLQRIKDAIIRSIAFTFNEPRGLAHPAAREIVVDMGHPAHCQSNGRIDVLGLFQTIVHEKTHMLIFNQWSVLEHVAKDLRGRTFEQDQIIRHFYDHLYGEKSDLIEEQEQARRRLQFDPVWTVGDSYREIRQRRISFPRLISELLAIIHESLLLPSLSQRLEWAGGQEQEFDQVELQEITEARGRLASLIADQKHISAAIVKMRNNLERIDQRITSELVFDTSAFSTPLLLGDFDVRTVPLPLL